MTSEVKTNNVPIMEVRNIDKSFPGVKALDDVSVKFYPGEVNAVVGENGAGKSTLMKVMVGAYKQDQGHDPIPGGNCILQPPDRGAKNGHQHYLPGIQLAA